MKIAHFEMLSRGYHELLTHSSARLHYSESNHLNVSRTQDVSPEMKNTKVDDFLPFTEDKVMAYSTAVDCGGGFQPHLLVFSKYGRA